MASAQEARSGRESCSRAASRRAAPHSRPPGRAYPPPRQQDSEHPSPRWRRPRGVCPVSSAARSRLRPVPRGTRGFSPDGRRDPGIRRCHRASSAPYRPSGTNVDRRARRNALPCGPGHCGNRTRRCRHRSTVRRAPSPGSHDLPAKRHGTARCAAAHRKELWPSAPVGHPAPHKSCCVWRPRSPRPGR
ncbi:Uncharacterised protein [Mycobacteroides abscessus subsp. abscessus]|nr:Uncharacterised protein [Mycobacteroides abscessus subsp. abscessus]